MHKTKQTMEVSFYQFMHIHIQNWNAWKKGMSPKPNLISSSKTKRKYGLKFSQLKRPLPKTLKTILIPPSSTWWFVRGQNLHQIFIACIHYHRHTYMVKWTFSRSHTQIIIAQGNEKEHRVLGSAPKSVSMPHYPHATHTLPTYDQHTTPRHPTHNPFPKHMPYTSHTYLNWHFQHSPQILDKNRHKVCNLFSISYICYVTEHWLWNRQ